ncbi:hypothetical protein [Streptomyces hesseae]|uniref:Integral membrane protein n=1 Tax=Streptomyces hesseae TaxID=3075519 RepID=A0ABU2SN16_9ACTN|nr:hypothetical protein [Streptomyces sp. DSM 40473]MDT0450371.1 hypothetical protein [Streptomyces sp. DSM 40473]
MATDENSRSSRPHMPSREGAAEALALAEQAQVAVVSVTPGPAYSVKLSLALAGVYLSHLLPEPWDFVGIALMYVLMLTVIVAQFRSSGVRHRVRPGMKRGMLLAAVFAFVVYLTALYLDDHQGMPWIWAPAGLLVGGGILVHDRQTRKKGIAAS